MRHQTVALIVMSEQDRMGRLTTTSNQDIARSIAEMNQVTKLDTESLRTNDSAVNQKLGKGERDFRDRRRSPKNISSTQEFIIQSRRYQAKGIQGIPNQKASAVMMLKAGYSPQAIQRAIRNSPAASKMTNAQFQQYYRQSIQPALRSCQAIEGRKQMAAFKQKHGIPQGYTRISGLKRVQSHYKRQQVSKAQEISKSNHREVAANRLGGFRKNSTANQIKAARARAANFNASSKGISRGRKR